MPHKCYIGLFAAGGLGFLWGCSSGVLGGHFQARTQPLQTGLGLGWAH